MSYMQCSSSCELLFWHASLLELMLNQTHIQLLSVGLDIAGTLGITKMITVV